MDKDERIHGEMRVEYTLIPAAFAVAVYSVYAEMSNNVGSLGSDSDPWFNAREAAFARLEDPKNLRGGGRMNRIMIVFGCLLGLALACIPAYASPTKKKVTITCEVPASSSDYITGDATVRLCSSPDTCPAPIEGPVDGTVLCPEINCDSSGVTAFISITVSCDASFKVGGVTAGMSYNDSDGTTNGTTFTSTLNGKGVIFPYGNPGDLDSVSLTIK